MHLAPPNMFVGQRSPPGPSARPWRDARSHPQRPTPWPLNPNTPTPRPRENQAGNHGHGGVTEGAWAMPKDAQAILPVCKGEVNM